MKTGTASEFEDATPSSMHGQGSISAFVAMMACHVVLLLMLTA
jgi:hypothetical protein